MKMRMMIRDLAERSATGSQNAQTDAFYHSLQESLAYNFLNPHDTEEAVLQIIRFPSLLSAHTA